MAKALKKPKKETIKKQVKKIALKKTFKKNTKPVKKIKAKKLVRKPAKTLKLVKFLHNPIIEPRSYPWESKATFNPTAFLADDKVHLIYRAIGDDDISVLGYASSLNGFRLTERPTNSIYNKFGKFIKSEEAINYVSGGGWNGGCEDPRVVLIDDIVYMLYTAFDGWGSLRIALTSIKLEDFKKKIWNWEKPILISPPNEIHKNWVLFPEKINGKFAILHSISPKILIDYINNFNEFDNNKFIKSYHSSNNPSWADSWDNMVRGVGPAPLRTKIGWLVLYHAMDKDGSNRYKLGALLLDLKDPTKVLYRAQNPILEPDQWYENDWKPGIIYASGAVVLDGKLLVYYGAGDKHIGVASIKLTDLIDSMKSNGAVKLEKNKDIKRF